MENSFKTLSYQKVWFVFFNPFIKKQKQTETTTKLLRQSEATSLWNINTKKKKKEDTLATIRVIVLKIQ